MLLAWANDRDGRRVSVSVLDPERRRDRAPFACLACGEPLIARLGQQRARHFAHRPGSTCPLTNPETVLHQNAKERLRFLCEEAFAGRLSVRVGARCSSCRRETPLDLASVGDGAVAEGAIGSLRADVLVTRGGVPSLALEVRVTHEVEPEKERALAAAGVRGVEIDARDPWEEEIAGGVAIRVARSLGFERCASCATLARAESGRASGGESAAIAELEAYRSRGLMGPRPGAGLVDPPPLAAPERGAIEAAFCCPECGDRTLEVGLRLVQHRCRGSLRPVAWRGYDGALVQLAWWRRSAAARRNPG